MKISKEFKIGLVVIAALIASFLGFNLLKGHNLFSKSIRLYAVYPEVKGLTPSCPVKVNGMKIGMVEDVNFIPNDPQGRLLVTLRIDETDFEIPKGSIAQIGGDLLGSKVINVIPNFGANAVINGDTLSSGLEVGLEEQVNQIIAPLKVKVENLISSVDTIVVSFKEIFDDDGMKNVKVGLSSLRATIQGVELAIGQVNGMLSSETPKIGNIMTNLESVTNTIRQNNNQIENILRNVSQFSDSLKTVRINETVNNVNRIVSDLDEIVLKVKNGEGTLGALITEKGLYNKLDSAAFNLNYLISDIKENPGDYVHINLIKIGGGNKEKEKSKKTKNQPATVAPPDSTINNELDSIQK